MALDDAVYGCPITRLMGARIRPCGLKPGTRQSLTARCTVLRQRK